MFGSCCIPGWMYTVVIIIYVAISCCFGIATHKAYVLCQKLPFECLSESDRFKDEYRPFKRIDLHLWNYWTIMLCGVLWAPPRAMFATIDVAVGWMCYCLTAQLCAKEPNSPDPNNRAQFSPFGRAMICWINKWCAGSLLWFCGAQTVRHHAWDDKKKKSYPIPSPPSVPKDVCTLVPNHTAAADILVMMRYADAAFISKEAIGNWPFVGPIAAAIGCVFVNRQDAENREKAAEIVAKRQASAIKETSRYARLCIFAEGTTSNGQHVLPFKSGAFRQLTPIQPVLLVYDYDWFNPACDIIPYWAYFVLLLAQMRTGLDIYWLPCIYPPTQEEFEKRKKEGGRNSKVKTDQDDEDNHHGSELAEEYAHMVRQAISECMQVVHPLPKDECSDPLPDAWIGSFRSKARLYTLLTGEKNM